MTAASNAIGRRRVRAALAVVCVLLLASDLGLLYLRQPAHPFTATDAVRRYRDAASVTPSDEGASATPAAVAAPTPAPAAPKVAPAPAAGVAGARAATPVAAQPGAHGPTGPRAGVYTYATDGAEETDAMGGARQAYPATTTVTVRPTDCGWDERWQPLQERWDDWLVCTGPSGAFGSHLTTVVEFFHQTQRDDYDCGRSNLFLPSEPQPGQTWALRCSGASGSVTGTASVVSIDSVGVGGATVRAAHVRLGLTFDGNNRGTGQQDRWMDVTTGLLVRAVSNLDLRADSVFGEVTYHEHYRLDLDSLEAQT